jgi:hypothetical protein
MPRVANMTGKVPVKYGTIAKWLKEHALNKPGSKGFKRASSGFIRALVGILDMFAENVMTGAAEFDYAAIKRIISRKAVELSAQHSVPFMMKNELGIIMSDEEIKAIASSRGNMYAFHPATLTKYVHDHLRMEKVSREAILVLDHVMETILKKIVVEIIKAKKGDASKPPITFMAKHIKLIKRFRTIKEQQLQLQQ